MNEELVAQICTHLIVITPPSIALIGIYISLIASHITSYRIFYITAFIWQSVWMTTRCVVGCLLPICNKYLKKVIDEDTRIVMAFCVTSVLLFIEFIIQITMLTANVVVVYTVDNNSTDGGVENGGLILSGIICVLVLAFLGFNSTMCICFIQISKLDCVACCSFVDCCSGAVTRCCKLCRRRERQYVGIHGMPQMEPEPPYDTIEMLPVNESQMEPVPPYDTIEMLPVNESQMETCTSL